MTWYLQQSNLIKIKGSNLTKGLKCKRVRKYKTHSRV